MKPSTRRLIESYLPLDSLNTTASKEKLHPKHYVTLVHYWPARRPITACRAMIYATFVPEPNTDKKRKESADFVTQLATYKPEPHIIDKARKQIQKYNAGGGGVHTPKILDMFAGGGSIPLEAARLGCESHALEYNPVAYLIELCTLVYPQKFGSKLADEFENWSKILLDRMEKDVRNLYPEVSVSNTEQLDPAATTFETQHDPPSVEPVAYIWARTVPCRRPGCKAPVPLVNQSWLRKKGKAIAAVPKIVNGRKLHWEIVSGASAEEIDVQEHQTGSGQAVCVACGTSATTKHVKKMAVAGKMKESLAAVVVQDQRSKLYLSPSTATLLNDDACIRKLNTLLNKTKLEPLNEYMNTADSTTIAGRGYGISQWRELFTPRQLLVLFTLVKHIRDLHAEMLKKGMDKDRALALTTYFAMAFDRFVSIFNKFARWFSQGQCTRPALGDRQALKMVYDFSEINCLARTQGCLPLALEREAFCIRELAKVNNPSIVTRGNAEKLFYDDETFDAIITDPPYYSSIYYADLSAFFYVWLKRIVGDLYPEQFALASPPKRREAVAQPSMHDGDTKKANDHYQDIMMRSFSEARRVLKPGAPFVCVYAHKTTTGWAILIRALIDAKFTVTEAWPVQTESPNRMNTNKAAALSDSIFVVARRREESRVGEYETDVKPELDQIARERVVTLWDGGKGIGGADLLMAAVGAGLRAYTKFESVQYANGESMSAEQYLREVEGVVLNVMLDEIFGLGDSSVGFVDPISRFYILWRFTYQELSIDAGEAYVFCNPQGIEIDDSTGPPPLLIEKIKGKFRVRTWEERGDNEKLGISADDYQASLIDTLHRLLWLIDNQPINVQTFLKKARPNIEQLKLVASALSAPILKHSGAKNISPTKELHSLEKLIANWQNLVEGSIFDQEAELKSKGQTVLPPSFVGSEP